MDYNVGSNVDAQWQTPNKALGKAEGTSFDIVSLGRGGAITLIFANPTSGSAGFDLDTAGVINQSPVPIPGTLWLLASGLFGMLGICRRKYLRR